MPWSSSRETCSLWKRILSDSALPEYTHVINPTTLKDLYQFLVYISSETQQDFGLDMCHDSEDICKLSDILFKELEKRFEQCFSIMCNASDHKAIGGLSFLVGFYDAVEVVNLLLRCCMVLLTLISDKENLILEKGKVILSIHTKVSSLDLSDKTRKHFELDEPAFQEVPEGVNNGFNTSENANASVRFPEHSNLLNLVKSTVLEVLIDEILVHEQLRGHLEKIDLAASVSDHKYHPRFTRGCIGIVMRAICNHFILTFSDKQEFRDFLFQLFPVRASEFIYSLRAPALGMTAAVSLLFSPLMISAPKYLQAHVVSLVSKAMDSVVNIERAKPDHKQINCFLSTFEKSVVMYVAHMSGCPRDGYSTCAAQSVASKMSPKISYPLLESYMPADMNNKVQNLINELDNSPNLNLHECLTRNKSDLVSSSISFVKEYQNFCGLSCQDEIVSILTCLIHKASESWDDTALVPVEGIALQNIFLLSSLLKLMSLSLLQAIRCLRHSDDPCCPKVLKNLSSCKEYDLILGSINCFKEFRLPLQEDLSILMSSHSTSHVDSKVMLLHFYGLMSQSFASGRDCLVKGCLLTITALLNLFVFEEGNLDALSSMVKSLSEPLSDRSPANVRFQKAVGEHNPAFMVASKFQKLRSLRVRKLGNSCVEMDTSPSSSHGTRNGEVFFECLWSRGEQRSDIEDIVDFVECEEPDEYAVWFNNRQRYRKRKRGTRKLLVRERNKKSRRKTRGKRT